MSAMSDQAAARDRELLLEIDHGGELRALGRAARERLGAGAGRWRCLPSGGEMLVLERLEKCRPGRGVKLSGSIEGPESLMSILTMIHMNQDTGELHVSSGDLHKTLYFQRGKLLSATSNQLRDRLGEILVRMGVLNAEDRDLCLAEPTERLGRELVRRGLATTHQIYEGMRLQSQQIFASALFWERGIFYVVKPLNITAVPAMLHLDVQGLILEGLRRNDELDHLRAVIPSADAVLRRASALPDDGLDDLAGPLYQQMDGARSLFELIDELHLDELEATRAAAELVQLGCAEIVSLDDLERTTAAKVDTSARDAADIIADAYGDAIAMLGDEVAKQGVALSDAILLFMRASDGYADIFEGVGVSPDGIIDRRRLVDNVRRRGDPNTVRRLHRSLNDMLFFLLFEASHSIDLATMETLRGRISRALSQVPHHHG